jgi:hypothetical protein
MMNIKNNKKMVGPKQAIILEGVKKRLLNNNKFYSIKSKKIKILRKR